MTSTGDITEFSVVIRCGCDPRIFDCIASIDEDVDIVVSTIDNSEFLEKLKSNGVRYCTTPPGNLSLVSNEGIEHAKYEKVMVTDSDTIFKPGCIRYLYNALDRVPVARPQLDFRTSEKGCFSKYIANARKFVNSKQVAFTPGLAFRKEIKDKIGGYYFDDSVPFAVDADLNYRLHFYNVPVEYFGGPGILHDAECLKHDLKAAKRIGNGTKISSEKLSKKTGTDTKKILHSLKAVHHNDYSEIRHKFGAGTLLYQMVWDLNFYWGRLK